jgi:hypothetical protein
VDHPYNGISYRASDNHTPLLDLATERLQPRSIRRSVWVLPRNAADYWPRLMHRTICPPAPGLRQSLRGTDSAALWERSSHLRPTLGAVITDYDIARMTEACRDLPEPVGDYVIDDYLTNLVATVVDFQNQTTAVERALGHFATQVRPNLDNLADLVQLMGRWPADQAGNTSLALPVGLCNVDPRADAP